VITTHALFALKVQRKVSNGVVGLAGRSCPYSHEQSCIATAAQLKRE
jgi:hypothetical protein